ncbi:MAG: CopG family transcriptional regulator [Nitrososphaerota archaeon]|jgi:predicted transcriptional regulator|nr:MAG: hypothetical protein KatS3mg087_1714 [Patescibacteria group bacterium]
MSALTKRVQVLLSSEQYKRLETIARTRGTSIGALIRDAIEKLYFQPSQEERLQAVRNLANFELPVSDWEQMERESMQECELD